MALTGGEIVLLDRQLKTVWKKKVAGEILDIAVSSGPAPAVAALFDTRKDGQKWARLDNKGVTRSEGSPVAHAEQIELSAAGDAVLVYGNSSAGQKLSLFPAQPASKAGKKTQAQWTTGDSRYADYTSSMIVSDHKSSVILGFEDIHDGERRSHLIGLDFEGRMKWDIPLDTEEGAYFYAHSFSSERAFLVVGTDDSTLQGFRIADPAD